MQYHGPMSYSFCFVKIVGCKNDAGTSRYQLADDFADDLAAVEVYSGSRFVQEGNLWVCSKC